MTKRLFDIFVTIIGLLLIWPLLLALSIIVLVKHGTPVFFRQVRPGFLGKPFVMCKFRTMSNSRDVNGNLLPDNQRLTVFGRFLRSTSLDELPELINVLKGEMSLVGPRPLLIEYLDRYTPAQARRHDVRPGITGWAQINGRQNIKFSERIKYDVWYVDHRCMKLDLKILFLTLYRVIQREGVKSGQDVQEVDDLGAAVINSPKTYDER